MYHIWTMQMARWRLAKMQDIQILDITAKSGVDAFAPNYHDVMRYKYNEIDEIEYTRIYNERMAASKVQRPKDWEGLKKHERVALACYCRPDHFCHRHLFAPMMKEYLEAQGLTVSMEGELMPPAPAPKSEEQT